MTTTMAVLGEFGNAIHFIFHQHESPSGGAQVGGLSKMWALMWPHLKLSGASLGIACAISVPLGLWLFAYIGHLFLSRSTEDTLSTWGFYVAPLFAGAIVLYAVSPPRRPKMWSFSSDNSLHSCGNTTNFIFMPSCSSLQTTVQTTTYSPGSVGAVI